MAAVADFNSGNMLQTPNLSIFTARMTLSLNHLNHPVKPTPCEVDINKSVIILLLLYVL